MDSEDIYLPKPEQETGEPPAYSFMMGATIGALNVGIEKVMQLIKQSQDKLTVTVEETQKRLQIIKESFGTFFTLSIINQHANSENHHYMSRRQFLQLGIAAASSLVLPDSIQHTAYSSNTTEADIDSNSPNKSPIDRPIIKPNIESRKTSLAKKVPIYATPQEIQQDLKNSIIEQQFFADQKSIKEIQPQEALENEKLYGEFALKGRAITDKTFLKELVTLYHPEAAEEFTQALIQGHYETGISTEIVAILLISEGSFGKILGPLNKDKFNPGNIRVVGKVEFIKYDNWTQGTLAVFDQLNRYVEDWPTTHNRSDIKDFGTMLPLYAESWEQRLDISKDFIHSFREIYQRYENNELPKEDVQSEIQQLRVRIHKQYGERGKRWV